jgi:hypothetical protein
MLLPSRPQLGRTLSVSPEGLVAVLTADRFALLGPADGYAAPLHNLAVRATMVLLHPARSVVALLGNDLPMHTCHRPAPFSLPPTYTPDTRARTYTHMHMHNMNVPHAC